MTFVSNVTLGQIQSALSVGRVKRPIGSTQYVRLVRNFFVDLILVVRVARRSGFPQWLQCCRQTRAAGRRRVIWLIMQG
jgi:hypothetical protein